MDQLYRYGDLLSWSPALALLLVVSFLSFSRLFERNASSLLLLVTVVCWIWANVTHGFVGDPGLKELLFYLGFAFLSFVPPAWVSTCYRLVGNRGLGGVLTIGFLVLAAFGFIAVLVSDRQSHWFFRSLELPSGSWTFYRSNGPVYWVFIADIFGSLAWGVGVLVRSRRYFSLLDNKKASLILWGVVFPMVAGILDVFKLSPVPGVALVPWSILVTASFFLWAILRGRLFVTVPLAYEILVQRMSEPVVVLDSTQLPVWVNHAALAAFPVLSSSGRRLPELFPGWNISLVSLREGSEVVVREAEREYRVQGTPAQDQRSGFEALALVFHDITALKAEQSRLEALVEERTSLLHEANTNLEGEVVRYRETQVRLEGLLEEKQLLLQEVNHRVKNNLQIITSLINLQARRLPGGSEVAELFAATQGRIRSISLVHDLIYRKDFGNGLDFRDYLETLVQGIAGLYTQQEARIEITASEEPVQCGVDFSVDFGLVIHELVTNALKHGIVPEGGGVVTVGMHFDGPFLILSVRDTGHGFVPPHQESNSLGLNLVRSILKKYRAELTVRSEGGTTMEVRIPWEGKG